MSKPAVKARPITYTEIEALATGAAPPEFEGYVLDESYQHGRTLVPATFTAQPRNSRIRRGEAVPHDVLYAAVPDDRPNAMRNFRGDTARPVGHRIEVRYRTMFGTMSTLYLFTSPEAEQSARDLSGYTEPERGRYRLHVPDDHAAELPLLPVFGAQLTVGVVIEGCTSDEAAERAEAALRAEFGAGFGSLHKVRTRPVADRRVNVFASRDKATPIAFGVLDAETAYLDTGNACYVEEAVTRTAVVD